MRYKNVPETLVPMIPVHLCRAEELFETAILSARMPKLSRNARQKTIDE